MSTDSHSAMAAELARYRKALRAIADLEGDEPGSGLMAARLASAALAGGDGATTYYRALVWDETGTTYRVGEGEPRPVLAWNVRLWFEDGDSTHFHTDAPKRRRQP